jgi:Lar family restriction alleviation protein
VIAKFELMACPFCGGVPKISSSDYLVLGRPFKMYGFVCAGCGAVVSFRGNEEKAEAITAWNTRAEQ